MPRVTITVPGGVPQPYRFQLDHQSVVFGRTAENDIQIDSPSVSSRHAKMVRVKGGYELHDLGSTNGVKLNGERLGVLALRDGSSVELGDVLFGFELAPEERAVLDMEASVGLRSETAEKPQGPQQAKSPMPPPSPPRIPAARPMPVTTSSSSGGSGLLLLFLALLAFCAGMAFRYQTDTGRSWFDAVRSKFTATQGPTESTR